jgi:ABC-type uncharacterized transport system auxiliary subunit
MRDVRAALLTAAALAVLAAVGCQSGPAPRDHFYRLDVPAPTARSQPALAGTLEVDRLRVEAVAQGRRILFREAESPDEVRQHAYHHWSNPPSEMLQEQMVRYFRAAGIAQTVVTPAVRVASDYRLTGRIGRLERNIAGNPPRVTVELELALIREEGNELLLIESYREERSAVDADVSSAVRAIEEALGAILARFVADVGSRAD